MMKKWKKVLALLLCLVQVCMISPMSTIAIESEPAELTEAVFTVTSVKGVTDKEVHVEVRVSENSQIASLGIELLFDSSELLVTNFAAGEIFESGMSAINGNVSDKIIASYVSMEPVVDAGTLFSVDFLVTTEEINKQLDLIINVTEMTDINGNSLSSTSENGTVEVVDLLYGDLDFNNRITAVDALKILASTTKEVVLTDEEKKAGDVNGDGEVTVSDALSVLYFSAEMISDFSIYNLPTPTNLQVENLGEYEFTITWDHIKDVLGYNVYLDGELVNSELLTDASVTIGGNEGTACIAPRIHNSIDHNTAYDIQITAVNALKETDKSEVVAVKTKRAYSMVTFKDWDGTVIGKTVKVLYGQDAVVPNDPVREGYVFIGWDKPTTHIIEDAVITALYEVARYDYIFYDYDGKELYRQNVVHGGTVTPPVNPTKRGYTFAGWYTAVEGGSKVTDFGNVKAETKVYAQYTINQYTVSFNSNGGNAVSSKSATFNTTISAPTSPTRLGYGFSGWHKDKACTNKWDFSKNVVTDNTTLYAKWVPVTITIDKSSLSLDGQNAVGYLKATITGGTDSITWSSSDTSIATVDSTGKVTAKGHGEATIYIKGTSSERRPVCKVKVNIAKTAWIKEPAGVNLRASNTSYSSTYGVIPYATKITVYGDTKSGNDGRSDWISASYTKSDGTTLKGYVAAEYISYTEVKKQTNNNSYVSGNTTETTTDFKTNLAKLEKELKKGMYWQGTSKNMKNVSSTPFTGNTVCGPWDGECTTCPVDYYVTCHHSNGYCDQYGCHGCGVYRYGNITRYSCAGYASTIFYCMYGKDLGDCEIPTKSTIKAGDVIWYGGGYGHYVFVTKVYKSGNTTKLEFTDANGEGSAYGNCNKIRWGAVMDVPSYIRAIYRP